MDYQQQTRWRPTRTQVLATVGIVAALTVAVLVGYRYDITLWDWIKLLIVPGVIAGGGIWFNRQQREREQQIASDRAQDEALQAYLDQMSDLLLEKDLRGSEERSEVRTLATARTINMITRLDGEHNRNLVRFLMEAGLIYKFHSRLDESGLIESEQPIIILSGANLSKAELSGATLIGAYLGEADLSEADLSWASLYQAVLGGANLSKANLSEAWLDNAILPGANLSGANLSGAILTEVNFNGAKLGGANLDGAKGIIEEDLTQQALYLDSATMPNGKKYEDWVKDKVGRREDGENSGPS